MKTFEVVVSMKELRTRKKARIILNIPRGHDELHDPANSQNKHANYFLRFEPTSSKMYTSHEYSLEQVLPSAT